MSPEEREQFELTTFTPHTLRTLFVKAGFEVLTLIGKTVLPVRTNKRLLETQEAVERLRRMEEELHRDPSTAACAGHLQITARNPA